MLKETSDCWNNGCSFHIIQMSKTNSVAEKLLFQRIKLSQTFLSFPLQLLFGHLSNKNNFLDIKFELAPFVNVFRISKGSLRATCAPGQRSPAWLVMFSFFALCNYNFNPAIVRKIKLLVFWAQKGRNKDKISLFAYNWFVTDKVQCHKWKPINYRCHSKFNEAFGLAFLSIKCQCTGRLLILNSCGSRSVLKFPSGLSTKLKPSGKTSKKAFKRY